jgi:predicted RNA-binding Zn-ribbon protein involved in translation (DUF1610 family)
MPYFRCTSCHRRVNSPVVIGAGDCPHCGGDVVFDVERGRGADEPAEQRTGRMRRLWRRLRRR